MNSFETIKQLGINAKKAAAELANIRNEQKNNALYNLKEDLKNFSSEIIKVNNKDIENAYVIKLFLLNHLCELIHLCHHILGYV